VGELWLGIWWGTLESQLKSIADFRKFRGGAMKLVAFQCGLGK
jgi:hypothetical protein